MERKVNRRLKLSEKQWICRTKRDHPGFSNSRIAQNVREEFGITVTRESIRKTLSKEAEIMAAMVEEPSQQSRLQSAIRNKFEAKGFEERVLNRVIEKMGECDIEDEDNLVELIEIAEEPPRKKQKQAKMTSFFVKKLNKSQKPFSHFAIFQRYFLKS